LSRVVRPDPPESPPQPTTAGVRLWRRALYRLAENVDHSFAQIAAASRRKSAVVMCHAERMTLLRSYADFYDAMAQDTADYFGRPEPLTPVCRVVRRFERRAVAGLRGEVIDLVWPSTFQPLGPEEVSRKYLAQTHNTRAHARWFRHGDRPRPTLMLLHGYLGGMPAVEERLWPIGHWFDRGLDVMLTCLPFHGPRADPRRRLARPRFPSGDPRFTVEGFRQVVFDHRALVHYLLEGRASAVGVMGVSLGGYSTALLATLEPQLACAVPVVPLASLSRFAQANGRLAGDPAEQDALRDVLDRVYRTVDPLGYPPQIPAERTLVIAGRRDRVTPVEHAERIAAHLGAPLVLFEGGHLLQTGRRRALHQAEQLFERLGFFAS
jgi:dienelactone hydrolase